MSSWFVFTFGVRQRVCVRVLSVLLISFVAELGFGFRALFTEQIWVVQIIVYVSFV